jgi:chromosome segregation ATPase
MSSTRFVRRTKTQAPPARGPRRAATRDPVDQLTERVRELESRLARERSRSAGLERGVTALDAQASSLRSENARLRKALERVSR